MASGAPSSDVAFASTVINSPAAPGSPETGRRGAASAQSAVLGTTTLEG